MFLLRSCYLFECDEDLSCMYLLHLFVTLYFAGMHKT